MFRYSPVQMELVPSLIVGGVVLGIEIKPGKGGYFESDRAAQPAARHGRFKGPVVSADVRQIAFVESAAWSIDAKLALPLKVPGFPPHHDGEHLNIAEPVGCIFLMNAG